MIDAPSPDEIRTMDVARLKAVLSQLRTGLDDTSRSVVQLRRMVVAKRMPLQDRTEFDQAYAQVRVCEVALRASILAASSAPADNAATAQAKVADAYEAYARAVLVAKSTAKSMRVDALAANAGE